MIAEPRRSLGNRRERGTAIAEFAIAATFVLTVMFGVIDFGRALFTYNLVAHAARLGTRYAIVRGSSCNTSGCTATAASIASYVQALVPGVNTSQLTVSTAWTATSACSSPPNGPACLVTVTVSYPFTFVAFPYGKITMSSSSQMAISQ